MRSNQAMLQALLSQSGNTSATNSEQRQLSPLTAPLNLSNEQQQLLYINALAAASFQGLNPSPAPTAAALNVLPPAEPTIQQPNPTMPAQVSTPNYPTLPPQQKAPLLRGRRSALTGRRVLSEREQFVVFVKILFKCLDLTGDSKLRPKAKAVVRECTRRNRMGDSDYCPLQDAVERRLRGTVGELHWARAKLYFDQYCQKRGLETFNPVPV